MSVDGNQAGWFEIPVLDVERAVVFHEQVFVIETHMLESGSSRQCRLHQRHRGQPVR